MSRFGAVAVATVCLTFSALVAGCGSSGSHPTANQGTSTTAANQSASTTAAKAATGTPITIGFEGALTGVASSTFADGPAGAMARIDQQNAEGGVNGHPLKLLVKDDQSATSTEVTAVQLLASKGVFGIISDSAFSFAGTKLEQAAGIPEIPVCACGPQYAQLPYTNTFSYSGAASPTIINGLTYTSTTVAQFFKDIGVTKLAGLGYGISAASIDSIKLVYAAVQKIGGISTCYQNYSVPFGAVDFTAAALQLKAAGCNGIMGSFVDASDVALSQAVKNGGIQAQQLYFTGYDEDVLTDPAARNAFQNVYAESAGPNFTTPNEPTKAMVATLTKYDPGYKGGIPDLGLWGSYIAADLMIKGLELAGPNPTRAAFISNLRNLTSYNAEGILPTTVSFQHFGTPAMLPQSQCAYFMQLVGSNFVVYKNQAICGSPLGVKGLS